MAKRTPLLLILLGVAALAVTWVWVVRESRQTRRDASEQVANIISAWRTHSLPSHGLLIVTVVRDEDLTPIKGVRVIPVEGVLPVRALGLSIHGDHAETEAGESLPAPLTNSAGLAWIDFESGRTIRLGIAAEEPYGLGAGPDEALSVDVSPLSDGEVRTRTVFLRRTSDGFSGSATGQGPSEQQQVSVIMSPTDGPADFGAWVPLADKPLPQPILICALWRNGRYLLGLSSLGAKPGELLSGTTSPEVVGRLIDQFVVELGSARYRRDPIALDSGQVDIYALRDEGQWSLIGPASALDTRGSTQDARTSTERVVQAILDEFKNVDIEHATKVAFWNEESGFDSNVFTLSKRP